MHEEAVFHWYDARDRVPFVRKGFDNNFLVRIDLNGPRYYLASYHHNGWFSDHGRLSRVTHWARIVGPVGYSSRGRATECTCDINTLMATGCQCGYQTRSNSK